MAITLFRDKTRLYYRITRSINGKSKQEYVRIPRDTETAHKQAYKMALQIDDRLQQWQKAGKARRQLELRIDPDAQALVLNDGRVVGLQLQTRYRDGRRPATEFKIRVKLEEKDPIYRSVSVDKWGFHDSFDRSVDMICELRDIPLDGAVNESLKRRKESYMKQEEAKPFLTEQELAAVQVDSEQEQPQKQPIGDAVDSSKKRESPYDKGLFNGLLKEITSFRENRASKPEKKGKRRSKQKNYA